MSERTAVVVGAGIGGLAAAIALQRSGVTVRVLERSATLQPVGFGITLAPNAMAALEQLGVADAIGRRGHPPHLIEIRHPDGKTIRRVDMTPIWKAARSSMVMVQRSALQETLLNALGHPRIELSTEATALHHEDGAVSVTTATGLTLRADIVIGADGFGSTIRRLLHPAEPPPRPSGYWALRGLARGASELLGGLSAIGYLGPGVEAAAVHAGEDAVYWYVSFLAADAPTQSADVQGVLTRGLAPQDSTFQAIIASSDHAVRVEPLFMRDPLWSWGRGSVTLLGDAAHPVLPHTGQGAALALEDAVALGLALGKGRSPAEALRAYESVRQPRTARVIRRGPRAAAVTTTRSSAIGLMRSTALRVLPMGMVSLMARLAPRRDPHRLLR